MPSPPAGESPSDAWVTAQLGRLRPGERVLVLGRTRSTLSLVRRWASRRGGVLGLEVAAASGLAAQLHRPVDLPGGDVLPADTALGRRIGDRPGLQRLAHRWVRELRVRRALGVPHAAPERLSELLGSEFGVVPEDVALLTLVAEARDRGRTLTASMRWDRVVALGFAEEPAFLEPAEVALAEALAGSLPPPGVVRDGPLPAIAVPDVAAEARAAAVLAAEDPSGTLILVASDATARRVRDALDRNGLGGALRDPTPLGAHPVASAVRRAAEWFGPDAPSLLAADLFTVLSRTSLRRRLHPAAAAWLAERLPDDERADWFDERALATVLERARLRDAPLARWLARTEELAATSDPAARRAAVHLLVRLRLLDACVRGVDLAEVLGGAAATAERDDFDDAVRELLGDPPGPALPPPGTFGALARFLVELRLRVHDDPVARAILGALRDRSERPATAARVHEALSGPGLDPGVLPDGVDVLPLSEWDGRPCRTLVVLDVHDHGLARPHPPDPLLADEELRALGLPTGGDRLAHALRTVRRAAAQAGRTFLVVARTDASGRQTVPPIELERVEVSIGPVGSYGARLPLPEAQRHARLQAVGAAPAEPPPGDLPDAADRRRLARGASLEWLLEGRQPHAPVPEVDPPASLSHALKAAEGTLPAALRPWLGYAEGVGEAALPELAGPDRPHSVSRLLQPLARCAFQAFAGVVLGVEERAALTDALDPRELGRAAHHALEQAAAALDFRRHADAHDAEAAVAALQAATDGAFERLLEDLGALSPARTASALGLRDRWKRHFAAWVEARRGWTPLRSDALRDHPSVLAAEHRFRQLVPAGAALPWWTVRAWIVQRRHDPPDLPIEQLRWVDGSSLPPATGPDLPAVLQDPVMDEVRAALREAEAHRTLVQGDAGRWAHTFVLAEVPFGGAGAAVPVHGLPGATVALPASRLRFGATDLQLQGQIDRIDVLVTERGAGGMVVTDYKTGRAELTGEQFRRGQWSLEDPQLLVYAMVLARAAREGQLPPELCVPAAAVAHDRVRHTFREKDAAQRMPDAPDTWMPVDGRLLRRAAQDLGFLVDGARASRWPLRPHRHRCPKLARGAVCAIEAGCRLRRLPDGTP